MDIKKYEIPFTILIAILAFLEITFLIKIIFSDFQGFEWGSVTDWVSALSSSLTLIFAIYAYSRWHKERYRDDAYQIQKEIITIQYLSLFNKTDELELLFKNITFKIDSHRHCIKDEVIEKMQIRLNELSSDLDLLSFKITNNIKIMRLFNYFPKSEFERVNANILDYIKLLSTISRVAEKCLHGLKSNSLDFSTKKHHATLTSTILGSERYFKLLREGTAYLYENKKDLRDFFVSR